MAGDNDDKDKKPKSTPSTETGAGDNPSIGPGEGPPSPKESKKEGQEKVKVKEPGMSEDDNDNFFDPELSDSEDSSNKKKRSPRRENAFDLLPGLRDVPVGRAQCSFLRAGLRQSMEVGRTEDDSVDNEEEVEVERTTKSEVINLKVESGNPVIDGTRALVTRDGRRFHSGCIGKVAREQGSTEHERMRSN